MPVIFVGHGSPMNAIEDNEFSRKWKEIGKNIPRPTAIVCISAHWESDGTLVTAMKNPKTIHDFGGFPDKLFAVKYPAVGDENLAKDINKNIPKIELDTRWGLDHGCWSVLNQMFPKADIPVVQISLDYNKSAQGHYNLAKKLLYLREKEILILCSGNIVHNLFRVQIKGKDFNEEFGFPWVIEANNIFKKLIIENEHTKLINYEKLGESVQLAIPTNEHYLPMIYAIALKQKEDKIEFFNDKPVAGSLTMTSFILEH